MRTRLARRLDKRDDRGLGLVELLVGTTLFLLLSGIVLGSTVTTSRVATSQREGNDLNEEARVLLNRLSRELREATEIREVVNPVGFGHNPAADSKLTFWVDLNGDGLDVPPTGGEPEVVTYLFKYDAAGGKVLLQVPGQTEPVLAGQVSKFDLTFTSSKYLHDGSLNGIKDGTVTWEELDGYPSGSAVGNGNRALDALELASVDSVKIDFTVLKEPRTQNYQTRVALRNKT